MRHPIYPDGNCFINAILYYLKEEGCEGKPLIHCGAKLLTISCKTCTVISITLVLQTATEQEEI
jgi:hypothetical protein